jgi:hypothetical protein
VRSRDCLGIRNEEKKVFKKSPEKENVAKAEKSCFLDERFFKA